MCENQCEIPLFQLKPHKTPKRIGKCSRVATLYTDYQQCLGAYICMYLNIPHHP